MSQSRPTLSYNNELEKKLKELSQDTLLADADRSHSRLLLESIKKIKQIDSLYRDQLSSKHSRINAIDEMKKKSLRDVLSKEKISTLSLHEEEIKKKKFREADEYVKELIGDGEDQIIKTINQIEEIHALNQDINFTESLEKKILKTINTIKTTINTIETAIKNSNEKDIDANEKNIIHVFENAIIFLKQQQILLEEKKTEITTLHNEFIEKKKEFLKFFSAETRNYYVLLTAAANEVEQTPTLSAPPPSTALVPPLQPANRETSKEIPVQQKQTKKPFSFKKRYALGGAAGGSTTGGITGALVGFFFGLPFAPFTGGAAPLICAAIGAAFGTTILSVLCTLICVAIGSKKDNAPTIPNTASIVARRLGCKPQCSESVPTIIPSSPSPDHFDWGTGRIPMRDSNLTSSLSP